MEKLIESHNLELKEKCNDTIAKEMVAFLNTDGGEIYIGFKDDGTLSGVTNSDEILQKISNIIVDQIQPSPAQTIKASSFIEENKIYIKISVKKGIKPLYFLKKFGVSPKGCFIRIGSTSREMTNDEIQSRYKQSILDNDYLLQTTSKSYPLTFNTLKAVLSGNGFHINENSFENSFKLINKNGDYNIMAEILSDKNLVPLILVKFNGSDKTAISSRNDFGQQSIINGYSQIKNRLIAENICKTDTTVRPRVDKYLFDMDCVNEILLNTLVHNDWTISEPLISIFNNRIEFTSHGGLPVGMSKEDFFKGVSCPRNATLMRIMLNIGLVEHTGHGIPTVVKKYGKQIFDINDSYINVTIPFDEYVMSQISQNGTNSGTDFGTNSGTDSKLSAKQEKIILEIIKNPKITFKELSSVTNTPYRTISRIVGTLKSNGFIQRVGNKKKGYWKIVK